MAQLAYVDVVMRLRRWKIFKLEVPYAAEIGEHHHDGMVA